MTATPLPGDPGPAPDHDAYSDGYLRRILRSTKVIAMVGSSRHWNRPSFFAMKYLRGKGYRIIPVNPGAAGETILGEIVYGALADLPQPVDMVDIFRNSEAAGQVTDEALALDPLPRTIWMQLTVRNDEAARRAEARGVQVVMNRCPKIEYARLFGELGWHGLNTGVISSKKRKIPGHE